MAKYFPLDPEGAANLIEKVGEFAHDVAIAGADWMEHNLPDFQSKITDHFPSGKRRRIGPPLPHNRPNMKRTAEGHRKNPAVFNLPSSSTMASGGTADEVPVVPPPKNISRVAPDYVTIVHPYYERQTITTASSRGFNKVFRLNSSVSPSISGAHQPMGRDTFTYYGFYRVLSSHIRITFINRSSNTYLVGYELTDQDTAVHPKATDGEFIFAESKLTHHKILPASTSGNPTVSQVSYDYTPEGWLHHVTNQGDDVRWTDIGSNPTIKRNLSMCGVTFDNSAVTHNMEVIYEISFTTQYRELATSVYQTKN